MSSRPKPTLMDYMVVGISPALIMAMVGSLLFYLLLVFYHGQYGGRLNFIFAMFVMAIVLIARISMERGIEYASLFAVPLALVTMMAMSRFVRIEGPMAEFSLLINIGLIALIWWSSHKLTWDCTLIDDSQDSSGEGLLQGMGFDGDTVESQAAGQVGDAGEQVASDQVAGRGRESRKKKSNSTGVPIWWQKLVARRHRPHTPGIWVVYFALAALPLFAIGQWLIPSASVDTKLSAFKLLVIYVGSALGLLVTTSFLGLRRYLRQRKMEMPGDMAGLWLGIGSIMILVLLAFCVLLPRPGAAVKISQLPISFSSPQHNRTHSKAVGNDGPERPEEANRTREGAKKAGRNSPTNQDGKQSGASSDKGASKSGATDQAGKSSGGKSSNSKSDNSKSSNSKISNGQQKRTGAENSKGGSQESGKSKDGQETQSKNAASKNGSGKNGSGKSGSGKNGSGKNGEKQSDSNKTKSNGQGKKQAGDDDRGKGESGEKSEGKGRPPRKSPDGQPRDGDRGGPKSGQREQKTQPQKTQPQKTQPQKTQPQKSQPQKSQEQRQESSSDSSASQPSAVSRVLSRVASGFGALLKLLFWAVLICVVAFFAWKYRDRVMQAIRQLIEDLKNLFANLFGAKRDAEELDDEQTVAEQRKSFKPFNSYVDPFAGGRAGRHSTEQLVRYTFEAMEAWARERACPRDEEQTPLEFARQLAIDHPSLGVEAQQLADLYSRVAYGHERVSSDRHGVMQQLWQHMRNTAAMPAPPASG